MKIKEPMSIQFCIDGEAYEYLKDIDSFEDHKLDIAYTKLGKEYAKKYSKKEIFYQYLNLKTDKFEEYPVLQNEEYLKLINKVIRLTIHD